MLTLAELKKRASKEGVPQAVIEKDYALSVALNAISESELARHLAFKGGTALKKVYFDKARFSEDLDFNVLSQSREQIMAVLNASIAGRAIEGITFGKTEEEKTGAGLKVALKFSGPFVQPQRIRLDLNFRINSAAQAQKKPLIDSYGLGNHEILVFNLDELFAEKIHALSSRSAPRDLYDTWFLFKEEIPVNPDIIKKKFSYYNEKFEFGKLAGKIDIFRVGWNGDLRQFLKIVPPFETVSKEVLDGLKKI